MILRGLVAPVAVREVEGGEARHGGEGAREKFEVARYVESGGGIGAGRPVEVPKRERERERRQLPYPARPASGRGRGGAEPVQAIQARRAGTDVDDGGAGMGASPPQAGSGERGRRYVWEDGEEVRERGV